MSLYHAFEELKSLKEMQYRYEVPGETETYDSYPQTLSLIQNQLNIAFGYAFLGNKTKALEYWNKIPQDIYLPEKWKVNTYTEFPR